MDVILFTIELDKYRLEVTADLPKNFLHGLKMLLLEDVLPVFGHKDQVDVEVKNAMSARSNFTCISHRPSI